MSVPTRKAKRTQKQLSRACDRLWAQVVLAKGYCEKCGIANRQLHPHHVYGRKDFRLRFEPRNGVCLCAYHHRYWAHAYPLEFADWFRTVRPDDAEFLRVERAKGPMRRTTRAYLDLEAALKTRNA